MLAVSGSSGGEGRGMIWAISIIARNEPHGFEVKTKMYLWSYLQKVTLQSKSTTKLWIIDQKKNEGNKPYIIHLNLYIHIWIKSQIGALTRTCGNLWTE